MVGVPSTARGSRTLAERLSERQRQCLELVARGYTSKQIARELALSPSTVDNHLRAAIERLGLNNRADAARAMGAATAEPRSEAAVGLAPAPDEEPPREAGHPLRGALRLPPLGGSKNRMSIGRRYFHVVQIALLGTMAMTAVVMTIAGLVQLFSR